MTVVEAQRRAFRITAPLALMGVVCASVPALFERYAWARELWLIRSTGWVALVALGLSLCATPASRVLDRLAPGRVDAALISALRRALGLSAAAIGGFHLGIVFATYLKDTRGATLEVPFLRSGLLAFGVLLVLAITSFPSVNRAARVRLWKHLHRLAYAAVLLAMHHVLLSPFAPRIAVLGFFGTLVVVGLLRGLPARNAGQAAKAEPDAPN